MALKQWNRKKVAPAVIIDAAKTIPPRGSPYLYDPLMSSWRPAEDFLEWARRGLAQDDELGWDLAVSYAKRAVCRRIDAYISYNHLGKKELAKYPDKIAVLREVGLPIPDVVHRLIIGPRNEVEHRYQTATRQQAEDNVELAEMFVRATQEDAGRPAIVSLGWIISVMERSSASEHVMEFRFSEAVCDPMLFVDLFEEEASVKVIYPADEEVAYAHLGQFNRSESILLARLLLTEYRHLPGNYSIEPQSWFQEMKRQTGI